MQKNNKCLTHLMAAFFTLLLAVAGCGGGSSPGSSGSSNGPAAIADNSMPDGENGGGSDNNSGDENGDSETRAAPPPPICQPANAGSPANLIGPIESDPPGSMSRNHPFVATELDLAAKGYIEEEYFFCGFAASQAGTYATRMIVRRPINNSDFSGNVFAEWINVTSLTDLEIFWSHSFEHLMREGHIYVGISAQRGGYYPAPRGLAHFSPIRYGQFHWPGGHANGAHDFITDPAAHDIYAQGLALLKADNGPLADFSVQRLIATGGSQSSVTLQTYYQQTHPTTRHADAFLLLILSSASAGDHPVDVLPPDTTATVGTPILQINSETDTDFSRKPDSSTYVLWEVAGTSHYDFDECEHETPLWLRDLDEDIKGLITDCDLPALSRIPFKHTMNAGMEHVITWLKDGTVPPSQPRFQFGLFSGQPERDERGNVLGGIRLPEHAVSVATNSRNNTPSGCFLYGSSVPFDDETLRQLYPTQQDYLTAFDAAADAAVSAGVLLPPDAAASKAQARQRDIPPSL